MLPTQLTELIAVCSVVVYSCFIMHLCSAVCCERIIGFDCFVFAAATASDVSEAANSETAVTDCQIAVDNLCLDNDGGMRLMN